jgi:hypothetical protein
MAAEFVKWFDAAADESLGVDVSAVRAAAK